MDANSRIQAIELGAATPTHQKILPGITYVPVVKHKRKYPLAIFKDPFSGISPFLVTFALGCGTGH